MIENLFYGVQLLHVWHFTHSQACWVFDVCVCVCVYVCVCVLFIYTISISIISVSQEEPSLIASNQQIHDFYKQIIFEKKKHCGK